MLMAAQPAGCRVGMERGLPAFATNATSNRQHVWTVFSNRAGYSGQQHVIGSGSRSPRIQAAIRLGKVLQLLACMIPVPDSNCVGSRRWQFATSHLQTSVLFRLCWIWVCPKEPGPYRFILPACLEGCMHLTFDLAFQGEGEWCVVCRSPRIACRALVHSQRADVVVNVIVQQGHVKAICTSLCCHCSCLKQGRDRFLYARHVLAVTNVACPCSFIKIALPSSSKSYFERNGWHCHWLTS